MKITRLFAAVAAAGICASPLAAWAQAQPVKTPAAAAKKAAKPDFSFLSGKTGTMCYSIWSEETLTAVMNKQLGVQLNKFVYTDSMVSGLAMLKSGRADFMMTSDITANYVIQRNPEFKEVAYSQDEGLTMLLRPADVKLRDALDAALRKLKASGKAAELYKKWITDLPAGQEPAMEPAAKTAYKDTIYVGVSGDMPPLDYMAADGKPSGYNIALLAEISKLIGRNIELLSIASQARFAALESRKIDVFFWQRMPGPGVHKKVQKGVNLQDMKNFMKNFIMTDPYCAVKTVFLLKK